MPTPQVAMRRFLPWRVTAVFVAMVALFATVATASAAVPTVTVVNPTSGSTLGGNTVTLTGTGFTGTSGITVGGTPATGINIGSDTSLTFVAPAHGAGAATVIVTNADGASTVNGTYTYVAPAVPTVTGLSPATGSSAGGTVVTITGTDLTGASTVTFGGTPATNVTVNSATSITATSPAHAAGAVNVIVTTPGGLSVAGAGNTFTYTTAAPVISAVTPATGSIVGGTPVLISGTGLSGATAVSFGGTAATTFTVANDTAINAVAPAHAAGQVFVQVTTPGGTSQTVAGSVYTYVAGTAPSVTLVSPNTGSAGGGTVITITGTGFTGATAVTVGGTAATSVTINSDTSITATTPAGVAGAVNVVVTTPAGVSPASAGSIFTYTAAGAPTVTAVGPAGGPITGGTAVTLTGTGFTGATSVSFGGTAAAFVVVSDTSITTTTPAHVAGAVNVIVTTPLGTSVATAANTFTYGASVPAVTGVNPSSGPIAGGTAVTITGTGFTGATSVTFGGTAGTSLTVVSDTSITVTTPAHAAGTVDVLVVTPGGTSAIATNAKFTYSGGTTTYTLSFRWSLIVWTGQDGISASAALRGQETPDNPQTNDVSSSVTAIYRWNGSQQKWDGYFPGSENVFGANDFTTLTRGVAYWIAISTQGGVSWTVAQ